MSSPHWPDDDAEVLSADEALECKRRWQHLVGMDHWYVCLEVYHAQHIALSKVPSGSLGAFEVMGDPADQSARIHVALGCDPDEARDTIRHEMLHLMLEDLCIAWSHAIGQLAPGAATMANALQTQECERLVRRIEKMLEMLGVPVSGELVVD